MREKGGGGKYNGLPATASVPHHRFKQMVENSFGLHPPFFFFFLSPRPGAIILAVARSQGKFA